MDGGRDNASHRFNSSATEHVMKQSHVSKRVICAAAAAVLTGMTFSVFVSAQPENFENRRTATVTVVALDAPGTNALSSFQAG
jgi:hypothetical protein